MKQMKKYLFLLLAFCLIAGMSVQAQAAKNKNEKKEGWIYKKYTRMYRQADGTLAKDKWVKIEGKKYYFGPKGAAKFGLTEINGDTYYITRDGGRQKGWQEVGGVRYYFRHNGKMVRGEFITKKGNTYYLRKNGKMAVGWLRLKGKKYYMDENGVMLTGEQWVDGKWRYFNRYGVYKPDKKITGKVDPTKPMIALTFDDGPGPYTDRLLNCLKKYNTKANFFLVGRSIPNYPEAVKKAFDLGYEIGSHTYDHPMLTTIGDSAIWNQMNQTNALLQPLIGQNATVMRPPYGDYDSRVLANLSVPAILWTIDTRDWEHRNPAQTIQNTLNEVKDGSIILMHDIHSPTVEAVEQLIPMLLDRGYQLVTVSELAKYKNKTVSAGQAYWSIY